ncbi:unnamed protein product [Polarella glacialis]|uniref:Uncharacterized protein n=1 Tax=Polarella glacialis TaxID=89957 RepID=A0A813HQ88_POLGL|nr:unnamed protein product [Polarella glacialis]CAE8640871.1 unnamed protein product [Polarella glacialis]
MSDDPFVCCEGLLPPYAGLFNFYATLTSVPLLGVPLYSLWYAMLLYNKNNNNSNNSNNTARVVCLALLLWLVALTGIFCTNLWQHMVGGWFAFRLHEIMAAVQALCLAGLLNALRRRAGQSWTLPAHVGLATAATASAAVMATTLLRPDWHERTYEMVQKLTAPLIVWTMGRLARTDARAWGFFLRSCVGMCLTHAVVTAEPHLCGLGVSLLYHALVDHACVWMMFGGVAQNAVRLVEISCEKKNAVRLVEISCEKKSEE